MRWRRRSDGPGEDAADVDQDRLRSRRRVAHQNVTFQAAAGKPSDEPTSNCSVTSGKLVGDASSVPVDSRATCRVYPPSSLAGSMNCSTTRSSPSHHTGVPFRLEGTEIRPSSGPVVPRCGSKTRYTCSDPTYVQV